MSARDRIDPESRAPLELLLQAFPGGFNAIDDIVARRAAISGLIASIAAETPPNENVTSEDLVVPGPAGAPDVPVRVYRPAGAVGVLPGVLYIHGGGMVMGDIAAEDLWAQRLCEAVGAIVISTGYRKAPEHPHPAQVDDCYASLVWAAAHADELGLDPGRLAVYGGSAGGNLAVATALTARDRGAPTICFVMAAYPMLDDRNETPSSHEITDVGIWDRGGNLQAWAWFLAGRTADEYAAPARATDLGGLPPAYLDVGELDLFRDEDIDFAARLLQAGVPTELHVYPGAYHASETVAPDAPLSRRIWAGRFDALRRALAGPGQASPE
jgi:acetyl esterase/lipase